MDDGKRKDNQDGREPHDETENGQVISTWHDCDFLDQAVFVGRVDSFSVHFFVLRMSTLQQLMLLNLQ